MAEKKRKGWRSTLKTVIIAFMINQAALPIVGLPIWSTYEPTIKSDKNKVESYRNNIPQNFIALDYLNLSSMIVHHYSGGSGVCRDFSKEIFNTYKKLIKENNRKDLEDNIRLSAGLRAYSLKTKGHQWIEIKHQGKWITYEATSLTPELGIEQIKKYSKNTLEQKMDLVGNDSKIVKIVQTFNGTAIFYPKVEAFINGGLIEFYVLAYD